MKKVYSLFILIGIAAFFMWACERDDICSETTNTTPQLVIEFFDNASFEDLKNISNLSVYAEKLVINENDDLDLPTAASDTTIVFNSTAINTISLPLIIGADNESTTTRYIFESDTDLRLNDDNTNTSNIDIIEITYDNDFVYISRACGFSNFFNLTNVEVKVTDKDNWINAITITNQRVQDENTTHVSLFH